MNVRRGFKTTTMEGGIRQTVTVQWPGHIAPGSTTQHIFTFWDFLPTAAELAGAEMPPRIDGVSAVAAMLGRGDEAAPPSPRTLYYEFCWNNVPNTPAKMAKIGNLKGALPVVYGDGWTQAVRLGDWKGYRTNQVNTGVMLFDLSSDIGELTDVASKHPDIVAKIIAVMEAEHTPNPMWPSANVTHPICCANCFSVDGKGCPAPCGGQPPPAPRPAPSPARPAMPATNVTLATLRGTWIQEGYAMSRATADWGGPEYDWQPGATFAFTTTGSDSVVFKVDNVDCSNCCWKNLTGRFDAESSSLAVEQVGPKGSCPDLMEGTGQLVWSSSKLCVDWHVNPVFVEIQETAPATDVGRWPRWCHAQ